MKKLFKTALSVIIALAVILVPMTVMAATGDYEEPYQLSTTSMRFYVTVEPAATAYVQVDDCDNSIVSVGYATGDYMLTYGRQTVSPNDDADKTATLTMQTYSDIFGVYNTTEETIYVYMSLTAGGAANVPVGTMDNPEEITLSDPWGMGILSAYASKDLEAGNSGYYYTVTAPGTGAIKVSVGAIDAEWNSVPWMYNVNSTPADADNHAGYFYGDTHFSDDDPVVDTETVPVNAGDKVVIYATTYNPENMFLAPAGTLNVNVSFASLGDYDYPDTPVVGENLATSSGNGYNYVWTASADGTVTVTMNDENWQYQLNAIPANEEDYGSYIYGNLNTSADETIVASETVNVEAGGKIQLMVNTFDPENPYSAPAGTVNWTFAFESGEGSGGNEGEGGEGGGIIIGGDEEPNYAESTTPLVVGTETYNADMMYTYTIYTFTPDEAGKYTFTSTDSLIGLAGYNWVNGNPSDATVNSNTYVWECTSVGQSVMIAVLPDTNVATITITREELDTSDEVQWTVYENTALTDEATLDGEQADVVYIDTTDETEDIAVLGEDGFYHLGVADGPVIFVNVNDKETLSLVDMLLYGKITAVYYDEDGNVSEKYDFTNALLEYLGTTDLEVLGQIGDNAVSFPLTDDLMKIYQMVGETNGWYGEYGFVGGELSDAWMFACFYNEDITTWGNPSAGDSNTDNNGSTANKPVEKPSTDNNGTSPVTGESAIALAVAMTAAAVLVLKTKKIAE